MDPAIRAFKMMPGNAAGPRAPRKLTRSHSHGGTQPAARIFLASSPPWISGP